MATKKTFDLNITNVEDGTIKESKVLALTVSADNSNYIIHRALKHQNVLSHQYTSSSKTRSEVRGGGRKPWKQKVPVVILLIVHLYGKVVELFLVQNQKLCSTN